MITPSQQPVANQVEDLQHQVEDLQAALEAITSGEVDALLLESSETNPGETARVYTRTTADRPYRVIVEQMGEGAATISGAGLVLYANQRLADLTGRERLSMLGLPLSDWWWLPICQPLRLCCRWRQEAPTTPPSPCCYLTDLPCRCWRP